MSEFAAGPAGRIERVRALMVERGGIRILSSTGR